jgi:hypothetical protein
MHKKINCRFTVTNKKVMLLAEKALQLIRQAREGLTKKLELVFIDKDGKWYPSDQVNSDELAEGFEKISEEIAETAIKERAKIIYSIVCFRFSETMGPSCVRRVGVL